MLQPSLSGNARISVVCTINPDAGAVAESMSTLLFAQRIKRVQVSSRLYNICVWDPELMALLLVKCNEEGDCGY